MCLTYFSCFQPSLSCLVASTNILFFFLQAGEGVCSQHMSWPKLAEASLTGSHLSEGTFRLNLIIRGAFGTRVNGTVVLPIKKRRLTGI